MCSPSSAYTHRLIGIGCCFAGGFTVLCLSGWSMVVHSSSYDTTLVRILRWLPIGVGVMIVVAGFYLLQAPIKQNPTDFFQETDTE